MTNVGAALAFDETVQVSIEEPLFLEKYKKVFSTVDELKGCFSKPRTEMKSKKTMEGDVIAKGAAVDRSGKEYRESLPIFAVKQKLIEAINANQLLVVTGDAGCGKTTQLPQFAVEAGIKGRILCTQPRRQAAISAATNVSQEMGTDIGQEVGYSIRFENKTSSKTIINYMTDGMLLREALIDPDLSSYSLIVVDETHERSIHTDVLFGLLKKLVKKRPDLKLIISSDSVELGPKLSQYFFDVPIVAVSNGTPEAMSPSVPKIQRSNLVSTILLLKAMDVELLEFEFMDAPPGEAVTTALMQLYALSALDRDGNLTSIGKKMAMFPLEPSMSKSLITSVELGCSEDILTIVSMLSVPTELDKSKFGRPEGDSLTLLAVYNSWKDSNFSESWFEENSVDEKPLKQAKEIRKQLLSIMGQNEMTVVSCGDDIGRVQKSICAGFFRNAAKKDSQNVYRSLVLNEKVVIHPSSALAHVQPEWVVFQELDTEACMRGVTEIEPKWLVEYAPTVYCISKKDLD